MDIGDASSNGGVGSNMEWPDRVNVCRSTSESEVCESDTDDSLVGDLSLALMWPAFSISDRTTTSYAEDGETTVC